MFDPEIYCFVYLGRDVFSSLGRRMDVKWSVFIGILFICFPHITTGVCDDALGMQNNLIQDSQIKASSELATTFRASYGRLFQEQVGISNFGSWCPATNDENPWFQVDLLEMHTISAVETQGAASYGNFVQYYFITYSYDGSTWYNYTLNGKVTRFKGNEIDSDYGARKNVFSPPITARLIRIWPRNNSTLIEPCMRAELYGCIPSEDCKTTAGMQDRRISNTQITASSHWNEHFPFRARLHNEFRFNTTSKTPIWGGWCAKKEDNFKYLQVDLGKVEAVSRTATQGYGYDNWVKTLYLNYSIDGHVWRTYSEHGVPKLLQANFDNETVKTQKLLHRVYARYIRFIPVTYNEHGQACMRTEIYLCKPTKGSVPSTSPPSATKNVTRGGSLNLTCIISGQPGAQVLWLKNGVSLHVPEPWKSGKNSVISYLYLEKVKFRDSGSLIKCVTWYPGVSTNTSRNIHLVVYAPRPLVAVMRITSTMSTLRIMDSQGNKTAQYYVRYKRRKDAYWDQVKWSKASLKLVGKTYEGDIRGLLPYTNYSLEVAPYYVDNDLGPYSMPLTFMTDEDAPNGPPTDIVITSPSRGTMRVSWSAPTRDQQNGKIIEYEVLYREKDTSVAARVKTERLYKDIDGLLIGERYEVAIRAFTSSGSGPFSSTKDYLVPDGSDTKPQSDTTIALEKLDKVKVTDENVVEVSEEVKNITAASSVLIPKDIALTANILKKVVRSNSTSRSVGNHLIKTVSHVMDVDNEVLQKTQEKYNSSAKFVKILEEYIEKGGEVSQGTSNIGVHINDVNHAFNKPFTATIDTTKDGINFNTTTNSKPNHEADASITIPKSVFTRNSSENDSVYVIYYRSGKLFQPNFAATEVCTEGFSKRKTVKSTPVLAGSIRSKKVYNLSEPVKIRFRLPPGQSSPSHTNCVFWDFNANGGRGAWSGKGCSLAEIINNTIICECDHMTNFAVLMDVYGPSTKACGMHEMALSLISSVGCGLSIAGLLITILTYGIVRKLRKDVAAKILIHLCVALCCVLIVFISGAERKDVSLITCRVIAVLLHYFLLVAFMWMLTEAYFMYQAFVKVWKVDYGEYVLIKCSFFAWGLPACVVIATLAVDMENYGGEHYCRLDQLPFYVAFLAPVVTIITINFGIFIVIMYKLSTRPASSADKDNVTFVRLKRAFGILILVGLTWILGFLAVSKARLVFHYLFTICNSLQGFAIFIFYCVTQKNVRDAWVALLRCDTKSLYKSNKSLYTDSQYERRRLSSASRSVNDIGSMRVRCNTNLSNLTATLPRSQHKRPTLPRDIPADVTIHIDPSPDDDHELSDDETSTNCGSLERLDSKLASGSPSIRSRDLTPVPSSHGSHQTVHSAQSTPKARRTPLLGWRYVTALDFRKRKPVNRTVSDIPKSSCPPLKKSKSTTSLTDQDNRFSGDLSLCSNGTSSESVGSDSGVVLRNQLGLPESGRPLGELILSPIRGSVRGIVGHVETTVDNFDVMIESEEKAGRSSSVLSGRLNSVDLSD